MSCGELVALITDYLEGSLSFEDRLRFEAHLERCPHCDTYLDQMRATIAAVGELREESLDPFMREQLLQAFRGWAASR
jgi:anti-sigma factor RsiW